MNRDIPVHLIPSAQSTPPPPPPPPRGSGMSDQEIRAHALAAASRLFSRSGVSWSETLLLTAQMYEAYIRDGSVPQ